MAKKDPLVPASTPFGYNVGINYESWEVGRTGYSINADLNQISQNFHLIRTYHDAAVGTPDPTDPSIDLTQLAVIKWIVKHPGNELVMGTNNNALANGGYGSPWSAGLMTDPHYTDQWVEMIINAFGSAQKVKIGLKAILLGNELDQNGPPPTDGSFSDYVNTWIPAAFDNLKASLAKYGLDSIPISTTIANYGATNEVSVKVPAYIADHWGTAWNNGEPFVMFNQYTGDNQSSTQYGPVEKYFESVEKALGSKLEVFVGETGYSTYWGASKQATVYTEIFDWLGGQKKVGGKTVPLFAFDAFDRPAVTSPADEAQYGIYGENSSSQPTGLKSGLAGIIPGWTSKHIGTATNGANSLYGSEKGETIKALGGDDIVLGLGGNDRLFGQHGADLLVGYNGADLLRGGTGADFLDGTRGEDILRGGPGDDTLVGGKQRDILKGGRGADTFVFDFKMTAKSAAMHRDKIIGFNPGEDSIHLAQSKFPELAVGALADDDTHVTYKNGALFYDGIKFAKFAAHAPESLGDIDIVVYA